MPISITALPGEFLREAGIDSVHELVRFAPNVHHAESPCCSPVFIRGLGSPFTASAFDPTVSLVLDELSIPKEIYLSDPLYDIERFEILRGPQGILFGKNTPAGLFNVTTGEPGPELTGRLTGRIGTLGVHRVEAAIGGPIGPFGKVARFRLAVLESQLAEDVLNTARDEREPGTEQRAGRLKIALEPFDGLEVLLVGERSTSDSTRTFPFQQHGLSDASLEFLRQYDPDVEGDGFNHQASQDLDGTITRETNRLQANLRYALPDFGPVREAGIVTVLGATGFEMDAPIDNDFSAADILPIPSPVPMEYDQKSAEIRVAGVVPAPFLGELDLLLGFLVFESSYLTDLNLFAGEDFEEWLTSAPGFETVTGMPAPGGIGFGNVGAALQALGQDPSALPPTLEGDGFRGFSDQSTSSKAVFGQAAWHPNDQWTASLGARVTFETKDAFLLFDCFEPGVLCAAFGSQDFILDLDREETDVSPKVTLQYFPFEDLALFASRAQGFKSGGFNNVITSPEKVEVDEEKTVAWEVGIRGTLLDGALSYGGTFFNMDVENLQVQQFLGGATVVVRNAGAARSRGLEADFQWLTPWEPLSIRGAGAFTDAIYVDFPDAPAPRSSGETEQDVSGRRMPFVSKGQLNVTPEVRFPLATRHWPLVGSLLPNGLALATAVDVLWRSGHFLDIDLDPKTFQEGYTILNGRVRLGLPDESASIGFAVENLTDVDVWQLATDSPVFPEALMVFQEYQRSFVFEAKYAW